MDSLFYFNKYTTSDISNWVVKVPKDDNFQKCLPIKNTQVWPLLTSVCGIHPVCSQGRLWSPAMTLSFLTGEEQPTWNVVNKPQTAKHFANSACYK